ncbi:MAG: DUF58 domain-containing protein [Candidatus Heimdallarchaeota archaeon]|nr:DUF58 domain-containing protein [Candidatus Heimdallarchaeota archaeon]
MKVKLNMRGQIVLGTVIVLASLSVVLRSPTLILISSFGIAYLTSYPFMVRNFESPKIHLKAVSRHGILFRGEIDVLKVEVYNESSNLIPLVKVKVTIPPTMYYVERPSEYVFSVEAKSYVTINIPVLPTSRGSHSIGPIVLSIGDPFLLYEQEVDRIEAINIRIYPKRLGYKVSKADSRVVFSKMIGLFATTHKGYGTDFHGLRDYIRGDPSKIVDWAATAKHNKLISREFEEEKRLEVIVALAAGTTSRGSKFDFMLGLSLDIFEGIVQANHPCSVVIFEDTIVREFKPTTSHRQKMHIWAQIYDMIPKDVFVDYKILSNWVRKKGKTGDLVIILGDFENDMDMIEETVRDIKARHNHVIFIDIWGYPFSYENEVIDAASDHAMDNYGAILGNVIGKGIKQDYVFNGLSMKKRLRKYNASYGYIKGPDDNIIESLDRALYSFFGNKWRQSN